MTTSELFIHPGLDFFAAILKRPEDFYGDL